MKTKYSNKYNKKKQISIKSNSEKIDKPMTDKATSDKNENEETNTPTEKSAESHEEFRDSLKPTSNEVTLEEPNDQFSNPHSQEKIHRGYALDGIRKDDVGTKQEDSTSSESPIEHSAGNASASPEDAFEPTPPEQEGDAPTQDIKDGGQSESGPEGEPFSIPTGSAEELIEAGAKALNYLIDQYGDIAVGIKIHQDFYLLRTAVPQIKEQNKRNVESIKLTPTEVNMLKKPLVKLMQEKGIRGLTPGEELMLVCVIIVAGKIKVVVQIRKENKMLFNNIVAEINSMKKHNINVTEDKGNAGSKASTISDSEIPLSDTVEEEHY